MSAGAFFGAIGAGLGIAQIVQGVETTKSMEEQARRNRELANKKAQWMQENWDNLAKPAMIRVMELKKEAQQAGFADSGIIGSLGTAFQAQYWLQRNQALELTTQDKAVAQEVYLTKETANIQYQAGMLEARNQMMNSIFSGINSGLNGFSAMSQYNTAGNTGKDLNIKVK